MSDISSEILHSLPFGVVVLDGQGIVIAHNGTWCNFLTTNNVPETCVGTDFLNGELLTQIYADSAPLVYQNITGVMRGALPQFKMEQVCSIPAGTVQVFSMMVVPLAAAAGGCIISLYDITDSIPMEQILSVPEDVFQSFFDCSAVGMVVCSSRQVIQKVNEKLCTLDRKSVV